MQVEVSIHELLAAVREAVKSDYIKGESILCETRYHPDTHYMVEIEMLKTDNSLGEKGAYIRKFLTEDEYFAMLQKQEEYLIKIKRQAIVQKGTLRYSPLSDRLDIPPDIKPEFKVYSDEELKRFNAFLAKVDIQTDRMLTIHQMLGTRISDTMTLRNDCLMEKNGDTLIRIYQMKTHYYEKPISQELAALIREAIRCTEEKYGKCKYNFANERDHTKPMLYPLIQGRITAAIHKENLKDDSGNYFTFGTHMYRHVYGVKLAEMHLDDWTI